MKLNRRDIWGFLAQVIQNSIALLMIPFILPVFTEDQIFFWYVLMNMLAFSNLLDFGITPTFSRNISYSIGGASEILEENHEVFEEKRSSNFQLISEIIEVSKIYFLYAGILFFFVIAAPILGYSISINNFGQSYEYIVSWALFCLGIFINVYFRYYDSIIQGRNNFDDFYFIRVVQNVIFLSLTVFFLLFKVSLYSLGLAFFISIIFNRVLAYRYANKEKFFEIITSYKPSSNKVIIFKKLWNNSWKLGIAAIGGFMIIRGSFFISGAFLGPDTSSSYFLSIQVLSIIQAFSLVYVTVRLPYISKLNLNHNNKSKVNEVIRDTFVISTILFVVMSIAAMQIFPLFLEHIDSNISVIQSDYMMMLVFVFLLETIHTNAAMILTTKNIVPFYKAAIFSGVAIIIVGFFAVNYVYKDLLSLVMAQLIIQLAYNNWKWPLEVKKQFFDAR
jgi:O-antigen/teichoic acid export membrane protein